MKDQGANSCAYQTRTRTNTVNNNRAREYNSICYSYCFRRRHCTNETEQNGAPTVSSPIPHGQAHTNTSAAATEQEASTPRTTAGQLDLNNSVLMDGSKKKVDANSQ